MAVRKARRGSRAVAPHHSPPSSPEVMHFDADTLTGADGSAVANWPDVVAGRPALVQPTSGSQPTLSVGSVNGHNAVVWADFLNKAMSVSGGAPDLFQNSPSATVFMVVSLSAMAAGVANLLGASTTAAQNRVMLQARGTTGKVSAGGRRLDADALVTFDTGDAMTTGVPHLLTVRYLWSSALMHVYLDGVLIGTSNPYQTAGNTSNTAGLQMFVGASVTGAAEYHHGQIMEILAWSVDDNTARVATEASLISKYAIGAAPPTVWDPADGILATAANTGLLPGWTEGSLTPLVGTQTITTPNTLIENRYITGQILVRTTGVTIRNCVVETVTRGSSDSAVIDCNHAAVRTCVITNCVIRQSLAGMWFWRNAIIGHDYTARYNHCYDTVDFMGAFNSTGTTAERQGPTGVVIENNYCHDLYFHRRTQADADADPANGPKEPHSDDQTHNDGVQMQGGTGTIIRGNNISAIRSPYSVGPTPSALGVGTTAQCVGITPNVSIISGSVVEYNHFNGAVNSSFIAIANSFPTSNAGICRHSRIGPDRGFPGSTTPRIRVDGLAYVDISDNLWDADGTPVPTQIT